MPEPRDIEPRITFRPIMALMNPLEKAAPTSGMGSDDLGSAAYGFAPHTDKATEATRRIATFN